VLGVDGWKHAEPILRSLTYAVLMHEDGNPAESDAWPDRPWRRNQKLVDRFPESWHAGKADPDATKELLDTLRDGSEDEAADEVVELLRRGVGPQSIWDGLFLAAGELLGRQPDIIALHSVTTTNALHYAYRFARDDRSRRVVLLQNASFLPMFRKTMHQRGRVRDVRLDVMASTSGGLTGQEAVDAIFAQVHRNPMAAAEMTLAYFRSGASAKPWIERAQKLIIRKGTGAHDFKFGFATLENLDYVSEKWRPYYAAASVFQLQRATQDNNPLIPRIRKALQT
jgi:hypothetical protein